MDFTKLEAVFHESKIRGMHATGIAYVKGGSVHIDKRPVPANEFPFNFNEYLNEDGNLYLIGHCRYSTSDLEYNQPIGNTENAIVHNGVITQELPENWEAKYGHKCETKNDSELVLHAEDPLTEYAHMSMAVCELIAASKVVKTYRNGKRPLYLTSLSNGYIITSTADIPRRAGLYFPTVEIPMNIYMSLTGDLAVHMEPVTLYNQKDYQHYAKINRLHPDAEA
jgi:glutamine phosphoribosylpyrophosphate amidotransferase